MRICFWIICYYNCKHCSSNSSMKPFKCTELIGARSSIKKSVTDASPQIINKVDHVTSKLREDVMYALNVFLGIYNLIQKGKNISVKIWHASSSSGELISRKASILLDESVNSSTLLVSLVWSFESSGPFKVSLISCYITHNFWIFLNINFICIF